MTGRPLDPGEDVGAPARRVSVDDAFDAACLVVSVALVTILAVGGGGPVRDVVAVLYTVFVPGRAIASYWPALARQSPVAISVILSLSALALVATVTLWLHFWHPIGLAQVEAGVTAVALATRLALGGVRSGRAVPEPSGPDSRPPAAIDG